MNIAVLGTGMVGQAIAGRLHDLGHDRRGRHPRPRGHLGPHRARRHGQPAVLGLARGARRASRSPPSPTQRRAAELVVNATSGAASLDVLGLAGADNLAGKVLVDIANPLDFSQGFPPTLFVKDTDSLGEQIQRAFPEAKVVKTLNTLTAALMVDPQVARRVLVDLRLGRRRARRRRPWSTLLESFGHADVIDLGDLETARGTEMLLPVWLRLMGALGTGMFNFKIVR